MPASTQRAPDERYQLPREARDPRFRAFFDYWKSKAVGDRLPGRQHIDPAEMRPFLSNLMLWDVVREADRVRFRIRLFAAGLYPLWQADLTGLWIEDFVPADKRDDVYAGVMHVVTTRQPQYLTRRLIYPSRDLVAHERLLAPLASDGETVDMLLGLYLPVPAALGKR